MSDALTRTQSRAVKELRERGFLVQYERWRHAPSSSPAPYAFTKQVLQVLINKGLAEPDRGGGVRPVGWAERMAHAHERDRQERAAARQARIDLIAGDPNVLAEAVVTLEERLSRIYAHTHDFHGRPFAQRI